MSNESTPSTQSAEGQSAPLTKRKSKSKRFIFLFIVPILVVVGCLFVYLHGGRYVETDNAYVKADKTPINAEVSGRVTDVLVEENQLVKAGQLLVKIDPKPFEYAVAQAKAHLNDVKTDLLTTKAEYQSKLANMHVSEAQFDYAKREEKRQYDLWKQNFSSEAQYEEAQNKSLIISLEINMFKTQLKQIEESLGGDLDRPVEYHPKYLLAQAELEQAENDLKNVKIVAPADGIVSKVIEKGQYISPNSTTMMLFANTNLWIEANFTEKEMTNVKVGQEVEIDVDYAPDYTWKGHVSSISPATGSEYSVIPAQNATGNWVKITQRIPVRIQLDAQDDEPQLRAGMSATVSVDTKNIRHLPF